MPDSAVSTILRSPLRRVRDDGVRGPIVILDLDAHPPDGLVETLGDDPDVHILSISVESSWNVDTATEAVVEDLRLEAGTTTEPYLHMVRNMLRAIPKRTALALYLAGADPLVGDPLGALSVSLDGLRRRDRMVFRALGKTPTVVTPGGGYRDASWRVLAGTLAETVRLRTAVDSKYDPVLRRSRDISRRLDTNTLMGEEDTLITEAELLSSMGLRVGTPPPRFLGFYTRHGLEYALTAQGYLTAVRRLGFNGLRVHVDPGVGGGADRMRLTAEVAGKEETLLDVSASLSTIEGFRFLFVEWLELRDPRATFTSRRPKLPGQRGPGLGLAEDTMQLLVRAAERLALHGVAFVAAHYHVAWMGRGRFWVLDPVRRGQLEALFEYFKGTPLLDASRLIGGPGIPVNGEPIQWAPLQMVTMGHPDVRARLAETASEASEARDALLALLMAEPKPESEADRGE